MTVGISIRLLELFSLFYFLLDILLVFRFVLTPYSVRLYYNLRVSTYSTPFSVRTPLLDPNKSAHFPSSCIA